MPAFLVQLQADQRGGQRDPGSEKAVVVAATAADARAMMKAQFKNTPSRLFDNCDVIELSQGSLDELVGFADVRIRITGAAAQDGETLPEVIEVVVPVA